MESANKDPLVWTNTPVAGKAHQVEIRENYDLFLSVTHHNEEDKIVCLEFKNERANKEDIEFYIKNIINVFGIKL